MWETFFLQVQKFRQKGSFVHHLSVATSWNIAIAATQFILSPIITRLYTPAQYGVFALMNSIIAGISLFSSFKYSEAILLTETKEARHRATGLAFGLLQATTLLSFIAIFIFHNSVSDFLNMPRATLLPYIIPIGVLLTGILEILLNINASKKNYFLNGLSGFISALSARGSNIIAALAFGPATASLLLGDFIGRVLAIISLLTSFKGNVGSVSLLVKSYKISVLKSTAKFYRSFPLYALPSSLLTTLSSHLPLYFFQVQYGSLVVGSFALASSLLEIINRLVPYTVSTVFLQKAKDLKSSSLNDLADGVYRLFKYALTLSTLLFLFVAVSSSALLPWAFGENWKTAGHITAILALYYAFNFVSVSLSEVFKVMDRQRLLLTTSLFSAALKVLAIIIVAVNSIEITHGVLFFSVAGALGSILQLACVFYIIKNYFWKSLLWVVLSLIILLSTVLVGII
jgi:O-antigen/teichoic acid export membrane protein